MAAALVAAALAALLPLVRAMQPGAVPPLPAPMRSLPWGDINFLHTTDTHGWHAGHLQESQYSADWGDYVSFAEHMRQRADDQGVDLLLVDTGDRVEGNGLYDASTPKGLYTSDIVREQDIDLICSGNHELYQAATIEREHGLTVPRFRGAYLASNLDYVDPATGARRAMAPQRYLAFQTKNRGVRVVAFGFLFNFTGSAANAVVQPVQQTVATDWFQRAIRDEPADLFVVIGHVAARMDELRVVYAAIRAANPHTPIALLAGHAHVRDTVRFDDRALAVASGRYLETIGWLSVRGVAAADAEPTFGRRYIDNNLLGFYHHSGRNASTFATDHGRNVTAAIAAARAALQLDARLGCAPQNYWLHRRPHTSRDSIFSLLRSRVLPEALVRPDRAAVPRLVIVNTGALRFDVFRGAFTKDTQFIISPFVSRIHYLRDVPYALARHVLPLLNNQGPILSARAAAAAAAAAAAETSARAAAAAAAVRRAGSPGTTDWRQLAGPEQYAGSSTSRGTQPPQQAAAGDGGQPRAGDQKPLVGDPGPAAADEARDDDDDGDTAAWPPLVAGYTTWDDLGLGGDDAIHAPLPYFSLPNCIQAEAAFPTEAASASSASPASSGSPDTVDLIFFDFIEKLVVQALNYAAEAEDGGAAPPSGSSRYTEADIETYVDGTFTEHFAGWVKSNWGDADC